MAYQINDFGKTVAELQKSGQSASKQDVPVGTFHDDGHIRYRWAFVKEASVVTAGKVMVANSFYLSSVKLSGSHFVSATGRYGGAGSREIKVSNAAIIATAAKFENGTLEIMSGSASPFVVPIESVEVGAAGKTTLVTLQGELPKSMATDMAGVLRPNRYYGVHFASVKVSAQEATDGKAVGVTTASGTTSGYQLLVTRGVFPAFLSNVTVSSHLVGAAASGAVNTATFGGSATFPVGRLLGDAGTAAKYFSVDWFFE